MCDNLIDEYKGQFGHGRTIDDVVDLVEEIPPMPDVLMHAIRLVDDPDATSENLVEVIKHDPALIALILRAANSAACGQSKEIASLSTSILVVGMGHLKNMLLATTLRRWNHNFGALERLVWQKSLGAASAACVLCEGPRRKYRDELYLTSLLHNLGQMVMLSHETIGGEYPAVINRIREYKEDFATAEREIIGFSHPLIGALIAHKWGLPLTTCEAILHYADPFEGVFSEQDEKLAMLKLTTGIGLAAGLGCPEGHPLDHQEFKPLAAAVGFDEGLLEEAYFEETERATKVQYDSEASAYA